MNIKSRRKNFKSKKWAIEKLTRKYGLRCWYCGIELQEKKNQTNTLWVDHIQSLSKDGSNRIDNLALTCPFCSLAKSKYDIGIFLNYLAYIRTGNFTCPSLNRFKHLLEPHIVDILSKTFYDYEKIDILRKRMVSKCCRANYLFITDDKKKEYYYICKKCLKSCDLIPERNINDSEVATDIFIDTKEEKNTT